MSLSSYSVYETVIVMYRFELTLGFLADEAVWVVTVNVIPDSNLLES